MAKTNPIGVRFDKDLLEKLILEQVVTSPQKALNLFEKTYMIALEKIVEKSQGELNKAKNDIIQLGMAVTKTEGSNIVRVNPLSEEGQRVIELAEIEKEKNQILEEIAKVQSEKIPSERNTSLGKKYWMKDQQNKINELKEKLNNLL